MEPTLITTASYTSAAVINSLLLLLLLTSWRGRLQGGLLLAAILLTIISAAAGAWHAWQGALTLPTILAIDNLRQGAWALFIVRLLVMRATAENTVAWQRLALPTTLLVFVAISGVLLAQAGTWTPTDPAPLPGPLLLGAIFVIWLVEQLFRNSSAPDQWAIKYLCIGVGGVVVFDAILFIDALLFNQINPQTWAARGFVQAIATPLIAIAATRNPDWEVKVFVSRGVVFFSGTLVVAGGYLLLVAAAGYFLKAFGGDWSNTLLATLLFAASLGLLILLSSTQLRGLMKKFITRNFYRNKYEYRDEWLKLTERLASPDAGSSSADLVALTAMRELLESPGGALWTADSSGKWRQTSCYEWPIDKHPIQLNQHAIEALQQRGEIITLTSLSDTANSEWPPALLNGKQPWLLIPLNSHGKLQAILQIGQSHSLPTQLDWEDVALVTAASHQVGAYLAFHQATDALAQARQFEAYNRLAAFLVHDLKNVVGQLQLVVQNSRRHANNPDFVADAFTTVDNAVTKMNAMLLQLRSRHASSESINTSPVPILELLEAVVAQRRSNQPVPSVSPGPELRQNSGRAVKLMVLCNRERMLNVLVHLVQNAQEATDSDGQVTIALTATDDQCQIEINDTGCGMAESFILNELFRPFKTTKGNAGMGIGVYESKDYIEAIGGRIEVTSELGVGSQFLLALPLHYAGATQ